MRLKQRIDFSYTYYFDSRWAVKDRGKGLPMELPEQRISSYSKAAENEFSFGSSPRPVTPKCLRIF